MLALLPFLFTIVPTIASAIFGDKTGLIAKQAVDMARTITSTDNDADAVAVLNADPAKATELSVALAKVAADALAAQEAQQTARLQAMLADTQSARAYSVEMAKSGSWLAWGAPVVTVAVMGLFGWAIVANIELSADMRETLKNLTIACVGYWIGSSRGSAAKDERGK